MTGDELAGLLERGEIALLDVRTRAEYEGETGYPCDPRQGHIPGAAHVELDELYAAGSDVRGLLERRGVGPGAAGDETWALPLYLREDGYSCHSRH